MDETIQSIKSYDENSIRASFITKEEQFVRDRFAVTPIPIYTKGGFQSEKFTNSSGGDRLSSIIPGGISGRGKKIDTPSRYTNGGLRDDPLSDYRKAKTGLFNTNKNPRICRRNKFDITGLEQDMLMDSKDTRLGDNYGNFLMHDLLNSNGTNYNKGPIQQPTLQDHIEKQDFRNNKEGFNSRSEDPRHYMQLDPKKAEQNRKLAKLYSKNARFHDFGEANLLLGDSFGTEIRYYDAKGRDLKYKSGKPFQIKNHNYTSLDDQYDEVTDPRKMPLGGWVQKKLSLDIYDI